MQCLFLLSLFFCFFLFFSIHFFFFYFFFFFTFSIIFLLFYFFYSILYLVTNSRVQWFTLFIAFKAVAVLLFYTEYLFLAFALFNYCVWPQFPSWLFDWLLIFGLLCFLISNSQHSSSLWNPLSPKFTYLCILYNDFGLCFLDFSSASCFCDNASMSFQFCAMNSYHWHHILHHLLYCITLFLLLLLPLCLKHSRYKSNSSFSLFCSLKLFCSFTSPALLHCSFFWQGNSCWIISCNHTTIFWLYIFSSQFMMLLSKNQSNAYIRMTK